MHQLKYTWRDRNGFLAVIIVTVLLIALYIYFR